MNRTYILPLVLLLAFVLRIVLLDRVPIGLTNDELTGVMNAYSLIQSGKNLDRLPWWKALLITSPGNAVAEFHSFYLAPWLGMFGLTLWSARMGGVIAGVLSIYFIFLLGKELSKKYVVGIACAALLTISPWHFFLSRSAYEAPYALMWTTLGLYSMVATFRYSPLVLLFSFIAAFHSYHAMKITVPLLCIGLLWWGWRTRAVERTKVYILCAVLGWVVVFTPIFFLFSSQSSRIGELQNGTTAELQKRITETQQSSSISLPIGRFVMNKVTFLGYDYALRLVGYFDVQRLFFGERTDVGYPIYRQGVLHISDIVLLLGGLYVVGRYHRTSALLLMVVFGAAVAPSVVSRSGISYFYRSYTTLVVLYVLMGWAIYFFWEKRATYLRWVGLSVIGISTISFAHFLFLYFGYMPAWGATWYNHHQRLVSVYIASLPSDVPVTLVSNDPQRSFLHYAFYYSEQISLEEIKSLYGSKAISINNAQFVNTCPDTQEGVLLIDYPRLSCDEHKDPRGNVTDAQRNWIIQNDILCQDTVSVFEHFAPDWSYDSLNHIRTNNREQMCRKWFYRL